LNLTSNAVKFTASGAIEVSARLLDRGRARQVLRFEVSDTGPGLDEETISRLFRPFTQADGSVTRKYGGTGLGLSICKRLVELMGGAIGVNSTPGAGSTFWFELPVAIPALPRAFPSALADAEGKGAVIVAPATRGTDFLRSYLKSWNIPATVAPTLTHAIELPWDSLGVEVVLIDARTIDSADPVLLQRLMNRIGDRRMVLLSASEDERSNVSGHDFAASLIKPFKKAALREAVVGAVSRQASSQSDTPERRQASHEIDIDQALKDDRLILLVEDNVVNQRVAIRQLNLLGYAAHIACNGQEAMDAIAKCRYALVLMDCQMPVMDGYEATRRIRERESEQGGRLQIVALTANAMQGDRERCIAAGMDDYLSKPILREHLQEMLSRRLPLPDSAASEICADTTSAATPVTLADVLNLERLDDIFGDDKHLQQEMLELFISTTRPLLEQFRLAAEQADFNEIAAIGHRLAGSCANIGIDRLAFLGGKAQTAAGMRDAAQSWKLYLEMQSSFALLTEAVTHHKVIA
jgi:CheY-like chemotaxis protein/HPt (histidine-containing phosphotransfer) domain-containing protein